MATWWRHALKVRRPPLMARQKNVLYSMSLVWLRGPATTFTEHELNGGVVSNGRSYSQWFELGDGCRNAPSHGENRGSSPLGSANKINDLGAKIKTGSGHTANIRRRFV